MSWVLFIHVETLCFYPAALCVHGREVGASYSFCSLGDLLKHFPLSQRGVSEPHSDPTGKDAFKKSSVGQSEGLASKSSRLLQPDEVEPLLCHFTILAIFFGPPQFSIISLSIVCSLRSPLVNW